MPNIKSAIKRVKVNRTKTVRNTAIKTAMKTTIRRAKEAIAINTENVTDMYKKAMVTIDKAVTKNILHKKTAARKKSKLSKAFNAAVSK